MWGGEANVTELAMKHFKILEKTHGGLKLLEITGAVVTVKEKVHLYITTHGGYFRNLQLSLFSGQVDVFGLERKK